MYAHFQTNGRQPFDHFKTLVQECGEKAEGLWMWCIISKQCRPDFAIQSL